MTVFPGLNQLLTKIGYETPGFGKERENVTISPAVLIAGVRMVIPHHVAERHETMRGSHTTARFLWRGVWRTPEREKEHT
jgi:hypothetical protein